MIIMQATIKETFSIKGIGVHTGTYAKVTIKPAPVGNGITFNHSNVIIPAIVDRVNNTGHGVSLKFGSYEIRTCEHLLSALYGSGIDNAICELDEVELPALDGSSLEFAKLIREKGIKSQNVEEKKIEIKEPILLTKGDAGIFAIPYKGFRVSFIIDYPYQGIRTQYCSFDITPEVYFNEIAPARTYTFMGWIGELREKGLIKGGSLENAIVIDENGPLNPLRFSDEPVRHKILDLIGDLALLGARLKGWVFGIKSGHALNIELVRRILRIRRLKYGI
ncbi:MAG: UDP-3-O-acyl-N-acetylglucosamine deacetylase [bacterium]|nr:UDP-3-O-acyl-N-acetylglucosamine deacetylase [bacterium]